MELFDRSYVWGRTGDGEWSLRTDPLREVRAELGRALAANHDAYLGRPEPPVMPDRLFAYFGHLPAVRTAGMIRSMLGAGVNDVELLRVHLRDADRQESTAVRARNTAAVLDGPS